MIPVELSEPAEKDLDELWDYLAFESIAIAERFNGEILERCNSLSVFPLRGRARTELDPTARSITYKRRVIFYEVQEHRILILRVVHGARNLNLLALRP